MASHAVKVRVFRKKRPVHESPVGEGCRWLFEGRDFWAEETAPIVVTGGTEEVRSGFLMKDLPAALEPAGSVVVLFSPEGPGGILGALAEALGALFPELGLGSPKVSELVPWGFAVERATRRQRVDSNRRLLMVDGFDAVWKASSEERARFAETLCCVARQRSMAVVVSVSEERLADCAELPGFGHAFQDRTLVPIVCLPV